MYALFLGQEELAIRRLDLALKKVAPVPHQIIRRTALAEAFARRRDREAALAAAAEVVPQLKVAQSRELNGYFLRFIRRDLPAAFDRQRARRQHQRAPGRCAEDELSVQVDLRVDCEQRGQVAGDQAGPGQRRNCSSCHEGTGASSSSARSPLGSR